MSFFYRTATVMGRPDDGDGIGEKGREIGSSRCRASAAESHHFLWKASSTVILEPTEHKANY